MENYLRRKICAGVLAIASKPHALAYKMGGCSQDGLMYGVLLYKSPKQFVRPCKT